MPINVWTALGNLTRDPDLRYTPKGTAVAQTAIACNKKWTGEDGQVHEKVLFMDLTVWGTSGENFSKYCKKGHKIGITGELEQEEWEDNKTGQKRSKVKCTVREWQTCERRTDAAEAGGSQAATTARPAAPRPSSAPATGTATGSASTASEYLDGADDSIPF